MMPDPLPQSMETSTRTQLNTALCALEGHCSELLTIADIIRSLTDLTAGMASAYEFALMGQFVEERTRMIEGIHERMMGILGTLPLSH
ncbi:hypothetical protein [Paremcibacter congregatus]|uniref:hypothetical protein n=1 Tax=Paremcibacter congregatus TaxID=2043170 RepID=UPI0030EC3B17|tara:strand:+ start:7401 stop:7664 length:264 start_codon:yes stop_codon:yes gene_type:complete